MIFGDHTHTHTHTLIQREEITEMLREDITNDPSYEGPLKGIKKKKHFRQKRIDRFIKELIQRKQLAALKDEQGRCVTGVHSVSQLLNDYWATIMTEHKDMPCDTNIKSYIEAHLNQRATRAIPTLWQDPNEDTVLNALEAIDPDSTPGSDGIPGWFYKKHQEYFVPKMMHLLKKI